MNFPKDKQLHLLAGFLIALVSLLLGTTPLTALGLVILLGIGKELYDLIGRGTPEVADIVYTVLGGLLPIIGVIIWQ